MRYYHREHIRGYERIKREGKRTWHESHPDDFENFSSREFLEIALLRLQFLVSTPQVLEYGCGTGPGACFLAERGFQVEGVDLIPIAIEIAREQARLRELDIAYAVQDITQLSHEGKLYDLIVDSYCLQGIVLEADRQKVFAAVQARLKPDGYYLISAAYEDGTRYVKSRFEGAEEIIDAETGWVFYNDGDGELCNLEQGLTYEILEADAETYDGEIEIGGIRCLPNRRHQTPVALKVELEDAGFKVLFQREGDAICVQGTSHIGLK